jgi:UDP-N-acetylglucosamine 2-epimerase (non-hydrolysing)
MPLHVLHVVGARPNFMKVSPVYRALDGRARQTLIHTGQHYDALMSDVFFEQLGIPAPDANLEVGSRSHAEQTGQIMIRFEPVVLASHPDIVLVYGDVNSTAATALVCSKLGITVGHVEAGLRSRDWTMPEEINRRVTDVLADLLFTPSSDGDENLAAEGVPPEKIHRVGNVMIDTLIRLLPMTDPVAARRRVGATGRFVLVTLHRPSNVDRPANLRAIVEALSDIARVAAVVFPIHPRTRAGMAAAEILPTSGVTFTDPLGYLEFLALEREAALVITDSGGVQEETTYLGVPCLTVRENTERPVTITIGTNRLVGSDMDQLRLHAHRILHGETPHGSIPPLWDGQAGARIAEIVTST